MSPAEQPPITREKILEALAAYEVESVRLEAEIMKLRDAITRARVAMGESPTVYRDAYGVLHHNAPAIITDDVDDLTPKDGPRVAPVPPLPLANPALILILIGAIAIVSVLIVILPRLAA